MTRPLRFLAVGMLIAVLAACGRGETAAPGDPVTCETMDQLVLAYPTSQPIEDTAPVTSVPFAIGAWESECLEVELALIAGAANATQLVIGGEADAVISATTAGLWIPRGQGVEIKSIYNYIAGFFEHVGVPADSPIQSWADLAGTTIGVNTLASGSDLRMRALAGDAGMDFDSIEFVATGLGASAAQLLFDGTVDALALWDGAYVAMENANPDWQIRMLETPRNDEMGFILGLQVMEDRLAADPDLFVRLARGLAKSTVFAAENPEAAVLIHWEAYPESKPDVSDPDEALERGVRVLDTRLAAVDIARVLPPRDQWGYIVPTEAEVYFEILLQAGLIETAIDVADSYTNEYIDEINEFDEEAIRAQARDWEA